MCSASTRQHRPRWWHSLSFRLNAWYMCVLAIVLVLGALGARWAVRRSIDKEQQLFISRQLERRQIRIAQSGRDGLASAIVTQTRSQRFFVRVSDEDNQTLAFNGAAEEPDFAARDLRPGEKQRQIKTIGDRPGQPWILSQTQLTDKMWLQIGLDDHPRRALLQHVEHGFWALLAFGALFGIVGGASLTRRALGPIRTLANTSREIIASGDLKARLPRSGGDDELDELSDLFNQVLDKNQKLVVGMREALDNVAHDLRTPLSRLRSSAELALNQGNNADDLREALADSVEESERVLVMLRTLMDISEAETGVMRLQRERVDLQQMCRDAVDLYEHVAEEQEVELSISETEPLHLRVDPQRIAQAVANLVDNAIKYSDPGGRVTIGARREGSRATLTVTDTGIGIDPVHLDKVWQRLYRADASRSRRGLGLGLSFVRAVVEAHGGSVHAKSKPLQGSTFQILLPIPEEVAEEGAPSSRQPDPNATLF